MLDQGPFAYLPAGALLEEGLADLGRGEATLEALLVAMAWPRLEPLGLVSRGAVERLRSPDGDDFELRAYRVLAARVGGDAHARFLALSAELESALNALEREQRTRAQSEQTTSP